MANRCITPRDPFSSSNSKTPENGYLAVHKRDFLAHASGQDFKHCASQILMNPELSTLPGDDVQETLESIETAIGLLTTPQNLNEVLTVGNQAGGETIDLDSSSYIESSDGNVDLRVGSSFSTRLYHNSILTTTLSAAQMLISDGISYTIATADGTTDAGALSIVTGEAGATGGSGGDLNILSGDGPGTSGTGSGGAISIISGSSQAGSNGAGNITISTGRNNTATSVGGNLQINTGSGDDPGSGSITMFTGSGSGGDSGSIDIYTGAGGTGDVGAINFTTGDAGGGVAGDITLTTGNGGTGRAGDIAFTTGNSAGDRAGNISLQAGDGGISAAGEIYLTTGWNSTFGLGGSVRMSSNISGASTGFAEFNNLGRNDTTLLFNFGSGPGESSIRSFSSAGGADLTLSTSDAVSAAAGDITLQAGDATPSFGYGSINLITGYNASFASYGGSVSIRANGGDGNVNINQLGGDDPLININFYKSGSYRMGIRYGYLAL